MSNERIASRAATGNKPITQFELTNKIQADTSKLAKNEYYMLLAMSYFWNTDNNNECWPSMEKLSAISRLSGATASAAVASLVAGGWINKRVKIGNKAVFQLVPSVIIDKLNEVVAAPAAKAVRNTAGLLKGKAAPAAEAVKPSHHVDAEIVEPKPAAEAAPRPTIYEKAGYYDDDWKPADAFNSDVKIMPAGTVPDVVVVVNEILIPVPKKQYDDDDYELEAVVLVGEQSSNAPYTKQMYRTAFYAPETATEPEISQVCFDEPELGHVAGESWKTIDMKLDKKPSVEESRKWDGWGDDDEEGDRKPRNRNSVPYMKFAKKEEWELRKGGTPFD